MTNELKIDFHIDLAAGVSAGRVAQTLGVGAPEAKRIQRDVMRAIGEALA